MCVRGERSVVARSVEHETIKISGSHARSQRLHKERHKNILTSVVIHEDQASDEDQAGAQASDEGGRE